MVDQVVLRQPDDWHVHLRDGDMLPLTVPHTARQFRRAIVMPNLVPPVTTAAAAVAYQSRIKKAIPQGLDFTPLMTCYLTDATEPAEIKQGWEAGVFAAAKLYPAHATTNSAHGVSDLSKLWDVFTIMQRIGMPLLIHGEVTDPEVDVFDRENVFIDRVLTRLIDDFPDMKIVLEHITTAEAVDFILAISANVVATITPHHLVINRNALFQGGLRPHYYCLPVAKRERHRHALRRAAVSGNPKFFLGTDSAPHTVAAKESACGCAGIFNAPAALETYATAFDEEGALDRLEGFASVHGPHFYGLPVNERRVVLERQATEVPAELAAPGGQRVIPFMGASKLGWRYAGVMAADVQRARPVA
jgi:dihydroorotase